MTEPVKPSEAIEPSVAKDPVKPLISPEKTIEKPLVSPTTKSVVNEHKPTLTEKQELLKKIQEILAIHDNKESEIGLNHEYWGLLNRYRAK